MSNSVLNLPTPDLTNKKLHIPNNLFAEMHDATKICKYEISMLGLLVVVNDGLVLTRLHIPEQVVGSSHVQVEPEHIMEFQGQLLSEGVIKPGDKDNLIRFAWHSHVDMPAKMSYPDRMTFSALGGNGTKFDPDWWVSMVMNRSGDYQVMWDQWQPIRIIFDITEQVEIGNPQYANLSLVNRIKRAVSKGKQTI